MEVHLSPELQAKVERAAAENKSGAEEYVKQLVEHYVDHDAWFRQQVTRGLDQLDRGEFLTHEEVGARVGDDLVLRMEGDELRITTLKRNIERAQRLVRKHVKPGTSLVDELIAERRGTARNE